MSYNNDDYKADNSLPLEIGDNSMRVYLKGLEDLQVHYENFCFRFEAGASSSMNYVEIREQIAAEILKIKREILNKAIEADSSLLEQLLKGS